MARARLTIDLDALRMNWRALSDLSGQAEAAAVVKADAYGLGLSRAARALAAEGARRFFVAIAEEGAALRTVLGPGPEIYVFGGHMAGDAALIRDADLIPLLNSLDQMVRHVEALPDRAFGVQLDSGMNRLGLEPAEWTAFRAMDLPLEPRLVMSHLACSDDAAHVMNPQQLRAFRAMTDDVDAPRSLAATGGILLGAEYHFELTRPGIGLYGGLPFTEARPVVDLQIPVIQVRDVAAGETVGYGNTWTAPQDSRIATVSGGYADGIHRIMGPHAQMRADGVACPVVGRISMDLIGVDVTALAEVPDALSLLDRAQGVDTLADWAGTIGYEVLTALGDRYDRVYLGG